MQQFSSPSTYGGTHYYNPNTSTGPVFLVSALLSGIRQRFPDFRAGTQLDPGNDMGAGRRDEGGGKRIYNDGQSFIKAKSIIIQLGEERRTNIAEARKTLVRISVEWYLKKT